ncbi:MAG: hypothetical protein ACOCZ3_02875 [Bacillota bacterium]
MSSNTTRFPINKLNYKDIIIILGLWYIMALINVLTGSFSLNYTPVLTGFFHHLFIFAGRFLFLGLVIFYLISLYPVTFPELGLKVKYITSQIMTGIILGLGLLLAVLLFINIPLSFNPLTEKFQPLYQLTGPDNFINSMLPFIILFTLNLVLSLSEQLLLNNILFNGLQCKLPNLMAGLLAALAYSGLLCTFTTQRVIINFIIAIISIYLYTRAGYSLILPSIFMSFYYTTYILYVYGWNYLKF